MLSLRMNKQNFKRFAIKRTRCFNNAFRIWSFSADFYFDIKIPFLRSSIYMLPCMRVWMGFID